MVRRRKVIGMTKHSGTEPLAASTATVFTEIENALSEEFEVKRMPFYWPALDKPSFTRLAGGFMSECDAILDSPGNAQFFQTRHSLNLDTRIAWFDLGALARGAVEFRGAHRYFTHRDAILVSCKADLALCDRLLAECTAPRRLVPFCVDSAFRPFSRPRERQQVLDMRRYMGIPDDTVVFLYAGRLIREKNVHAAILVFEQLLAQVPNALLLMIGFFSEQPQHAFGYEDRSLRAVYQQFLDERPALAARCRFYEGVNRCELPLVYNLADVFVSLTLHGDENFGLGPVEAMACGLPVVATAWGGLRDTVRHGVNGFCVDTRINEWGVRADLSQAVEYCLALARSASLRRELGGRGSEVVKAEYSQALFGKRIRDELRGMLARRGRQRGGGRRTRLSRFGARYHREFSDEAGVPRLPLYTDQSYSLYRHLIQPYVTGPAQQSGAKIALVPLAFRLHEQGFETLDPLWPKVFRAEPHELPLLARLQQLSADGQRLFDIPGLIDGLDRKAARRALRTLTRKGLLIGTTPQLSRDLTRPAPATSSVARGRRVLQAAST